MSGWSQMKLTASCVPWMRFTVPGGKPDWTASSMRRTDVSGTRSDGLSTKVLPSTQARGYIQRGIIAGKLKGAIPAQTPRGCR